MKDRLITAGGALLALGLVYVLFFRPPAETPFTRPTSNEAGRNGYLALSEWLEGQGVRVVSLRERFDTLLGDAPSAPTGNVLITTLPNVHAVRSDEHRSLRAWIGLGNTLLVMASIDDTPEWALVGTDEFLRQLTLLTGLKLRAGASDNGDAPAQPRPTPVGRDTQVEIEAVAHPLTDGVEVLRGYSDEPSELWQADPEDGDRLYLSLGRERSSGFDALWETPEGNGRIILVASGSLLTNHIVADSDAPRFIANVMRHHLVDTGAVIFDDMHQGLSVLYDPAAFFGDARLHATIVFLIAGWLVYLLGSSNRLAPPLAARTEPKQADFLGAVAGFMARRLRPRDAGLLLLEEWFDEIRRQRGLPQRPEPPWEELRATPALDRHTCDALETGYKTLKSGRAVDLVRLHNLLLQARRATG